MSYAELQVATHFSFLRGASDPRELFATAALLGIPALGITDRNSVAGMVRAWDAARQTGVRLVPGCRLDLVCGTSLLVWPEDRAGWSRLMRLLTLGKARRPEDGKEGKPPCRIDWDMLADHAGGLVAALIPDRPDQSLIGRTRDLFGDRAHLALSYRRRPGDIARLEMLDDMARAGGLTPLATGDVLYATPDRRMLQEVMAAIRENTTIDTLGFRRERFADRHMKSAAEMARLFRRWPDALAASGDVVARCAFRMEDLQYQYPEESTPGMSAQATLEARIASAMAETWPDGAPARYREQIAHELKLVSAYGYAPYFLTVNAIVRFARGKGILCQGRGSAANSLICFVLGITSIDPIKHKLLFERFISDARDEPPDIDVDFEHERREEVIQWVYDTYGHERAALTAVVTRYRTRGAMRDVGKALGLSEDVIAGLSGQIWGTSMEGVEEKHAARIRLDASEPRLALALELAGQLRDCPRHLSQHPGGFVLTQERLDDLVPIAPAAMADRRVIEWDKDDIALLKFMKVDVLGLGMLGCMRRAFDLLAAHKGQRIGLAAPVLQDDDPGVYAMIQKADTLGTFQIESRAQMSMLPRLKPKEFYDLVIQIAIVRPGPIQGDMVHPYLKRRQGLEKADYPSEELKDVLGKTYGVPLFQEQAMKVAIIGAGFTAAEADELRRSMATFKATGGVSKLETKMIQGMIDNGYARDFAERTFRQIEGFGSYGFPESHAASFAKIAYASCWMKHHHPDIFCCALLNAQPMGFYAPAQIVRDARDHGVAIRAVCINESGWDCRIEGAGGEGERLPVRLGLRLVRGLDARQAERIEALRPFSGIEDVWRRAAVSTMALERLAEADAFRCFGLDRRQALWRVRGLGAQPLPLFAAADAREGAMRAESVEPAVALAPMPAGREVVEDYRATQLSLRAHPLHYLRPELARRGILRCRDLAQVPAGRRVEVAGVILVRQRPGSGKGVVFLTIEDETGIANGILWKDRFEAQRVTVLASAMVGIRGLVQREGLVIHIVVEEVVDYTHLLRAVGQMDAPGVPLPAPGGGALRQKSRNFH
ncbi:error-prone DNA polymerase [Sphingomonas quercus]|uniref:Error-prone DNA polymerase n=1 Tax=Sphingomonas quercus TaxID=2842451 RepID=A0ABS6BJS0_9SPHN|nr:error-prone DNA polymerase [Sphingomonas quercus]MBU3078542.1 error-prone DNA polymerase [Sphingomonas quercus]